MGTSKHIDKICIAVTALTLVLTVLFMCGGALGIKVAASTMPYESTLFDTSYVHTIDIVMNDWDSFIDTCENEEYSMCTVVVDGKKHANVAIRAKGNTSLSTVQTLGSDRYSFKLEFDHYDSSQTLDGLDKLCLNNLIQDYTMMKDYIAYVLMNDFGVDSPLCSFAYLTVNGEDWGLYLAVEGIEDSFLARNYGSNVGDLYKPDSISNGGGRGNGKDFNMDDFDFDFDFDTDASGTSDTTDKSAQSGGQQSGFTPGGMGGFSFGNNGDSGTFTPGNMDGFTPGNMGNFNFGSMTDITNFDPTSIGGNTGGFSVGGMGSDDVKLKYIDDDPDSYSNIFSSAKTDVTTADQNRLIQSLKNLSAYEDLENTVDMDEVLRYFVVHNFVCNGDSYTGSMIHNYYLYEEDGVLSMIPWDYNLAYGTFQGGDASSTVNTSIDSPVSGGSADDRPMLGWIFSDETYTAQYHALFGEFIEKWFTNGELAALIAQTAEMIRPYVEKDPTKFCTTAEFDAGVTALTSFVTLRAQAVSQQLQGNTAKVATGNLNLSDMGTMNNGGGSSFGGRDIPTGSGEQDRGQERQQGQQDQQGGTMPSMPDGQTDGTMPSMPDGQTDGTMPSMPSGRGQSGQFSGTVPSGNNNGSWTSTGAQPSSNTDQSTDGQTGGGFSGGFSGDFSGSVPGGFNGGTDAGQGDAQGGGRQMPDGFSGDVPGDISSDVPGGVTGDANKWILVGVSFAVLAAGIVIAIKKKY